MKNIVKILVLSLVFVLIFGAVASSAYVAYDTYTYSISGKQMLSPKAYSTNTSLTSNDMGIKDKFGESGPALKLLEKYELDAKGIYKQVKDFMA